MYAASANIKPHRFVSSADDFNCRQSVKGDWPCGISGAAFSNPPSQGFWALAGDYVNDPASAWREHICGEVIVHHRQVQCGAEVSRGDRLAPDDDGCGVPTDGESEFVAIEGGHVGDLVAVEMLKLGLKYRQR